MWIVPKTLYHFVPDTEGLSLDYEEQAWMFSQSVTWRTKHSAKQTWLRRWKRERWVQHLFGRTLKPSTQNHFVEKWTESLEATHANHSVARESEKGKKIQDTSGPTSENTSDQLNLFGASSKTSKDTLPLGCVTSSKTWSDWVTERRGAYSQRRKLAHLTNGNESSSLQNYPTPAARDYKGTNCPRNTELKIQEGKRAGTGQLPNFVMMQNWATPNTMDHLKLRSDEGVKKLATGARKGRKRPSNLREQVDERTCQIYKEQNWPTPRTGGGSRPNGKGGKVLNEEVKIEEGIWTRGEKRSQQDQAKNNTNGKSRESSQLNPNWVEQLMGVPVGWTQISTAWIDSDYSGMGYVPKPQN